MVDLGVEQICRATEGKLLGDGKKKFRGVSTDTRGDDLKGKLYIPLVGDNFDAHKFVPSAVDKGASVVLVHGWDESWEPLLERASFVKVDDTLRGLQDLAHYWRKKCAAKVLGITGSNGKTTTKDFLRQILSSAGEVVASQGSFNNHWGVPLSLLEISQDSDFAVIEMGMNHPGELTELNAIVEPDIVAVSNVGRAHLGFFKNVEGIAAAKKEIYLSAPTSSLFVFNQDNHWTAKMKDELEKENSLSFSLNNQKADVCLSIESATAKGFRLKGHIGGKEGQSELSVWGEHNVQNIACASAMALAAGMSVEKIWSALGHCHTGWGRNQWVPLQSGGTVLFDGYNANPESFAALLKNIKNYAGSFSRRFGVFGEMLELGDKASAQHFELGELCGELSWEALVFIGPSGADFLAGWKASGNKKNPIILDTYEQFLDLDRQSMLSHDSLVVVKGSRGQKLERVVELLQPTAFSQKT